jgi:hypothetical protein
MTLPGAAVSPDLHPPKFSVKVSPLIHSSIEGPPPF